MEQKHLWQDGYSILDNDDVSKLGRFRLKRFLNWLDEYQQDWQRPNLDAYAQYLHDEDLHDETIYTIIHNIRYHYLAILSAPDNYSHIAESQRADFVNGILAHLEFNATTVRYEIIIGDATAPETENMRVICNSRIHQIKQTSLVDFVLWLEDTGRHWSKPDLIDYKEYLLKTEGREALRHGLGTVRTRYNEIREDESILSTLTKQQRNAFISNFRKHLGYMNAFPSKLNPSREMLEDDPTNMDFLSDAQVQELLNLPDTKTVIGLRDRAILGLAIATGLHRPEYGNVQVEHLRHTVSGQLALHVPASATLPTRTIPYDDYEWVLDWIDEWLTTAEITQGAVFRGTHGNTVLPRNQGIAPETATDLLNRYPIRVVGEHRAPILFGDIRATVGRRWYDAGLPIANIQAWLAIKNRNSLLMMIGLKVRDAFG